MEFYIPSKSNLTVKYEQRSLAGYNPWGRKELDMTENARHMLSLSNNLKTHYSYIPSKENESLRNKEML